MARMVGRARCLVMTSAARERRASSPKASAQIWLVARRFSGHSSGVVAGLLAGLVLGSEHLGEDVPHRAVDEGVGLVVEFQDGAAQPVLGPGPGAPCGAGAGVGGRSCRSRGVHRGPGPSPPAASRKSSADSGHGPAEDLVDVLEEVVPVRGVGLIGDEAGVIEADPSFRRASRTVGSTARPRATMRRVRAVWPAMPVLFRSQAPGSRNQSRPPTRRSSTVASSSASSASRAARAPGDVPGPVREGLGVGPEDLVEDLLGVEGNEHLYVTLDGHHAVRNPFPRFFRRPASASDLRWCIDARPRRPVSPRGSAARRGRGSARSPRCPGRPRAR